MRKMQRKKGRPFALGNKCSMSKIHNPHASENRSMGHPACLSVTLRIEIERAILPCIPLGQTEI